MKEYFPSLSALKASWERGESCVADARGGGVDGVNFLREFNSYFDRILWDDPRLPVALFNYLWNPSILVYAAEGEWKSS